MTYLGDLQGQQGSLWLVTPVAGISELCQDEAQLSFFLKFSRILGYWCTVGTCFGDGKNHRRTVGYFLTKVFWRVHTRVCVAGLFHKYPPCPRSSSPCGRNFLSGKEVVIGLLVQKLPCQVIDVPCSSI